ncbi:alpha/beta hydrolase [Marinobacter nanhaiticus D15-8W]|uniref:Alpha/beta hydrolase n=1 Tax=Marinobacter nanhaiticus D15-8W TaxID=626887 RepID=N6VSQ3_9GAMM|nr:alpha/beta hydrolase [Marinobacter nanhaiticus]ENO13175.1 alpha/beta hydrolase [Marinobacter nanhaiticus D15-8W]BES70535.1 alpha/beta hydrolase [Marinobacter nanhaiticus D15-8W]
MLQTALQNVLRFTLQTTVKPLLRPGMPVGLQRKLIRQAYRLSPPPRHCEFSRSRISNIPYVRVTHGKPNGTAMLYLHGGAYIIGSSDTHRGLTGHIAKVSGTTVFVPDYRLAPEHPFPAALEDALCMYHHLLALGYRADRISIAGDSAGGGLTLALALKLKQEKVPLPGALIMLSPWLDLTHRKMHTPEIEPVLQLGWIMKAAEEYSSGLSLDEPLISPLFGDLTGLPPMLVQVGTQEILLNDARRLSEKARQVGVHARLEEYTDLWHVFQIHAGPLEAANEAIRQITEHLALHVNALS